MLPSWETSFYLSTRKGAYQQKIFAHVTDPSCVWKQYTLRYSTFFAQISHCSMKDCSNTSWTYSTSTFTVSDWCIAVCKWWFFVWFVEENPDFPLCQCGFWGFCYHGVITTQLILNLISVYIPSNTLHSLFVLKTYSSYLPVSYTHLTLPTKA